MFVRTKKTRRGTTVYQLVETYRDEHGRVRQRVRLHLGPYPTLEAAAMDCDWFRVWRWYEQARAAMREAAQLKRSVERILPKVEPSPYARTLIAGLARRHRRLRAQAKTYRWRAEQSVRHWVRCVEEYRNAYGPPMTARDRARLLRTALRHRTWRRFTA